MRFASLWTYLSVSNQLTLGKSELEIIETLTEVVNQIIHEEKQIRQKLDTYNQLETQDRVFAR